MTDVTLSFILTAIGLVTVFTVLLLFYMSISLLMRIFRNGDNDDNLQPAAPASAAAAPVAAGPRTVELVDVDDKTAASIMAIVSHESEIPLEQLKFHTIKKLKEDK
jgi:Oxaloacetate decarboxylase, gamma chain.